VLRGGPAGGRRSKRPMRFATLCRGRSSGSGLCKLQMGQSTSKQECVTMDVHDGG
jgi:hypothetical protein